MEPSNECKYCQKQISSCYFLKRLSLCKCCFEILKGGAKNCETCRETIDINEFESPYLLRCKSCNNLQLNTKIMWKQCPKYISLSNMNKND